MSLRKRIILILLALGIVGLIALSFRPLPVSVSLATVERGPLAESVEEEGRTRVRERYLISAPVAGYMARLKLHAGDVVKAGDVLVELQPAPSNLLDPRSQAEAEARVAQAAAALKAQQSQLESARTSNDLSQKELSRLQPLFKRGDISRSAIDQAESAAQQSVDQLRAARAVVDAAKEELRAAQVVLRYYGIDGEKPGEALPLRSPVDGQVLSVVRENQGSVAPGEALLAVGDPDTLEVEVEVLSMDAVRIRPGMRVLFQRWGGEGELEGVVRTVEPAGFTKVSALGVEEQRVLVIADITSPQERWNGLGDAFRVEAKFILWEGERVLRIPANALFRHDGGWAVFTIADDTATLRKVSIGHRGGLQVEVLEGLTEGEYVITHPDESIEAGVRVEVRS